MRSTRVLIVAPTYSHPADQGNSARINALGRRLQNAGIVVDYLFYVLDWPGETGIRAMRDCWDAVHLLASQSPARQSHATCWGIDDWCPDILVDRVAELQAANAYDAVIVNYVWLSKTLEGAGSALKILDTHDLFGGRHLLAQRSGVEPNWFFTTVEDERRGFDRADVILAIQDQEMKEIQARTSSEVLLVSHPVKPHFGDTGATAPKAATFGYIASSNPWNQLTVANMDDAFADKDIDWLIGGRICNAHMKFKSHPFVFGAVDSVGSFYRAVECSLNPMVEATGLKIKTIEALQWDSPVIGTRDAFVGLRATHPFHQCTDASDVADAAVEFSRSKALQKELRVAGRNLFYSYILDVDAQYDALSHLVRQRGLPSGSLAV